MRDFTRTTQIFEVTAFCNMLLAVRGALKRIVKQPPHLSASAATSLRTGNQSSNITNVSVTERGRSKKTSGGNSEITAPTTNDTATMLVRKLGKTADQIFNTTSGVDQRMANIIASTTASLPYYKRVSLDGNAKNYISDKLGRSLLRCFPGMSHDEVNMVLGEILHTRNFGMIMKHYGVMDSGPDHRQYDAGSEWIDPEEYGLTCFGALIEYNQVKAHALFIDINREFTKALRAELRNSNLLLPAEVDRILK